MEINTETKIQKPVIKLDNVANEQTQNIQQNVSVNFDESSDSNHEEVQNDVNVNDLNNLDNITDNKTEKDNEIANTSETAEPSAESKEEKEKRTFTEWCNDVYDWCNENFGKPLQKAGEDIQNFAHLLGIDDGMKNKTEGNGVTLYQEITNEIKYDNTKISFGGSQIRDFDDPIEYNSTIKVENGKQLTKKMGHSANLTINNNSKSNLDFSEYTNLNSYLQISNQYDPLNSKVDTTVKGQEAFTYDVSKHLQNKTTIDIDEKFSTENDTKNDVKLSNDLKVSYEPGKYTKGSTTVSASEQYTNTDLKFSSGISSNMNYSDLLLYNGAQKLQLDLSSNANVFYNNDLKLENQLLDQNVGMKTEATGKLSYMEILYMHKNGSRITWDSSLTQKASYGNNYNLLKDEFTWNTDLYTGISTSLTFKVADQLEITPFVSGSYTLSTKDDTYDVGAGFKGKWTPFPDQKDFKISFGANYSRKDDTNPNTDKLTQELALNAGVDFDKNFGINASYDINLDGKKNNEFNLGARFNF